MKNVYCLGANDILKQDEIATDSFTKVDLCRLDIIENKFRYYCDCNRNYSFTGRQGPLGQ